MIKRILFLVGISLSLFGQDTISFKNGLRQAVKVSEVGSNEIKYQRWDNLTGPIYVTDKNEINSIKYSNGVTERYDLKDPKLSVVLPSQNQNQQNLNQQNRNSLNRLELVAGKKLMFQQRFIRDGELLGLISTYPNQGIRNNLQDGYKKMMNYKRAAAGFLVLGLGLGVSAALAGLLFVSGSLYSVISGGTNPAGLIGLSIGGAIGITGGVLSGVFNGKKNNKLMELVEIYNNGL